MAISNLFKQPQYYTGLPSYGTGGMNKAPAAQPNMTSVATGKPAVGLISTTPKSSAVKSVTSPKVSTSSAGSYKGTEIRPGTDAEIQAQIRDIDSRGSSSGLLPTGASSLSSRSLLSSQPDKKQKPLVSPYEKKITALEKAAGKPGKAVEESQDILERRIAEQQKLKSDIATAFGNVESQAIPLEFQQGRGQVLARQFAAQEAAAAEGVSAAQQGLSTATALRGQELSALQQAAALGQPTSVAPGTTLTDPTTGQAVAGGLGGYSEYQAAQNFFGLQSQYPDASLSWNPNLSAEQNLFEAQKRLGGSATYQRSTFGAPGATSFAEGTGLQTAAQGYSDAAQNYQSLTSVNNAAHNQAQTVLSILQSTGLNQGVPDFNKAINSLSRRLGSENVSRLDTSLAEMQNFYAQLLSMGGGTPTGQEQQALNILSTSKSAKQITAAIAELENAAYNRLQAEYGRMQSFQSNLGGGSTQSGGGSSFGTFF